MQWNGETNMDNYWLSRAASVEAELEILQREYEEMKRIYNERVEELEQQLLRANLNAQTRGFTSESI